MSKYNINEMQLSDLKQVIEIEKDTYKGSAWSEKNFEFELTSNEFSKMFVIRDNQEVIAYLGVWIMYQQSQITTITVKKDYQKLGLGKILMEKALEVASFYQCENMTLEVRKSNVKAQNLYHKYGFSVVATREKYYPDNGEDAYLMLKSLEVF